MNKHTFPSSDPAVSVTVSDAGLSLDHPAAHPVDFRVVEELSREILRLAEESADLKDALDFSKTQVTDLAAWKDRLAEENRALKAERDAPAVANRDLGLATFDKVAADRLADEVAALVVNRRLGARSAAADALLDYREPPRSERSDRIAALEADYAAVSAMLEDKRLEVYPLTQRVVALEAEKGQILDENRIHAAHRARLEAEVESLKADLALATRERPLPLSDGPPDFPLEREAFLAEEPEDQWLLYQEAAEWAAQARAWELDVSKLRAEVERLKVINREMAATCQHSDMVATQEGPLDV